MDFGDAMFVIDRRGVLREVDGGLKTPGVCGLRGVDSGWLSE